MKQKYQPALSQFLISDIPPELTFWKGQDDTLCLDQKKNFFDLNLGYVLCVDLAIWDLLRRRVVGKMHLNSTYKKKVVHIEDAKQKERRLKVLCTSSVLQNLIHIHVKVEKSHNYNLLPSSAPVGNFS